MSDASFLTVDAPDLILRVLCYVIELAEAGDMDAVVGAGFSAEAISNLRRTTGPDLLRVAATQGLVDVRIHTQRLSMGLMAIADQKAIAHQLAYLARAGASATILTRLFRISIDEAQAHLCAMGITRPVGRPTLPDNATRDQIHAWWADHNDTPARQRWIELHQTWPAYSVSSLYAVVNEFNL
jgi:hypothetical protein